MRIAVYGLFRTVGLVDHKGKLGTLGAVAVMVLSLIIRFSHSHLEQAFGPLDLRGNLGQVTDFQRRAILLNDFHKVDVVEHQIAVHHHEFVLGEVEGLIYKVNVLVFHPLLVLPLE